MPKRYIFVTAKQRYLVCLDKQIKISDIMTAFVEHNSHYKRKQKPSSTDN